MIKEKYLVSVIMPTHNRGKVIRRSIDSIINQSTLRTPAPDDARRRDHPLGPGSRQGRRTRS